MLSEEEVRVQGGGGLWGEGKYFFRGRHSHQGYLCTESPESEKQEKMFRRQRQKMRRTFCETFRRFSSINFQGKWPQAIAQRIFHTFPTVPKKLLSLLRLWELGGSKLLRESQTCIELWLPFYVAFAPLFRRGIALFRYRRPPCFSGKSYYFYRISSMNFLFSPPENKGQNVTRNGGPQNGACLIPSELHIRSRSLMARQTQDTTSREGRLEVSYLNQGP